MSDLFFNTLEELNKKEQNNLSTRQQNLINRTEEDTTKLSTRQQQLLDAEQQKITERHNNQELYGIEMSDEAYKFWNENVLQFSENPEEDAYKLGTAIRYSEMYDIPLTEAYNNVDMYNEALYGDQLKNTSYRNAFRVISDYWKLGTNEVKINDLGVALRRAKNENDTETYNLLLEKYNLLKQENELLQDNAPRFLTTEAIKFGARLAPFTVVTAGATIAGNLFGVGAVTGPAVSGTLMSGGEYINLIEQGSSHETAAKVSIATGALQGIIESAIGTSSLFSKLGSKVLGQESGKVINKLGQSIADKCVKEFHFSPFFANVAKTVTGSLINAGEEAIEEATQQITSIIGKNVAAELDGFELENNTLLDITKEITDAAVGGFLGGLVLGAPGMAINTAIDVREYDKVTKAAGEIQSKKMFKDVTKTSPIFNDLTDEDISKYQDNIYEFYSYKRNEDITEEAKDRAEIFTNDENFEEVTTDEEGNEVIEDVYRTQNGKLFTQNDITETEGNTTKGIFKAGDETKADKNLYGYINYSVNEDNKVVTIDKFNMNYERKSVLNEFYDDFAANFEGYNIEWHPTQSTAQTIKETLINNNPSGKNNGLNYYTELNTKIDQETRTEIARQIKDVYSKNSKRKINNKQLSSLVAFFESGFKTINKDGKYKSFTDFMNNVFSDGKTSFNIFGDNQEFQNILDQSKARELAQGNAINEQSYTIEGKRGSTLINELGDGVKATIYVFENGDFSTLAHEVTHIYRRLLPSDLLQKAEEALGITDGRWTEQNDEDFAVGFEEYLRSGKAKNNALKELYDMLAEFFQRVYGALKSIFNVSPELEQVYDELLSGDDSILQQAASAVLEANKKYNTEQKQQKEEQKQNETQTKEQERLEDSEVFNFNDEEVNAENETQTDEQEKDEETNIDNELKKDWIIASLFNVDRNIAEEIADKILDENATLTEKEKAILYAANLNEQGEILALWQGQNIPITLFQLIGPKGASNLDAAEETHYRMNNFQVAVDMTEEGKDAKTIRLATGWEKGVDGKWRYEIDDTKFKIDFVYKSIEFRKENPRYEELENKLEELNYDWEKLTKEEQEEFEKLSDKFNEGYYKNEATLEEILDAPELFKSYPELKKAVVKFKYNPGEVAGRYLQGKIIDEFFEIEENYHEIEINTLPNSDNEEKIKSILLHEIQHAIQRIEGFAKGGNIEQFKKEIEKRNPLTKAQEKLVEDVDFYNKNVENKEQFTLLDFMKGQIKFDNKEGLYNDDFIKSYLLSEEDILSAYNKNKAKLEKFKNELKNEQSSFDKYYSLAGEVEARNVQTRMTLTPEERKQKLLAETMDIARDQQIIMFQTLQDEAQQAIENVREQYINTDKWLKAPNGNDTNLTEKQWLQVRTPQFKAWFGDWENDPENASKVVDENGEPLINYHGTSYQFDEFVSDEIGKTTNNKGIFGNGFYFSNSKEMANYYTKFDKTKEGKVLNTYLNIKKPFIWSDPKNVEVARKLGFPKDRIRDNKLLPLNDNEKIIKFTKKLKDAGYDGVIYNYPKSYSGFGDNNVNETVAFYPNQIKSATDNSGEFNSENPSILFQTEEINDEQLKEILNNLQHSYKREEYIKKYYFDKKEDFTEKEYTNSTKTFSGKLKVYKKRNPLQKEIDEALFFVKKGHNVAFLPEGETKGEKNIDLLINESVLVELKEVIAKNAKSIANEVKAAANKLYSEVITVFFEDEAKNINYDEVINWINKKKTWGDFKGLYNELLFVKDEIITRIKENRASSTQVDTYPNFNIQSTNDIVNQNSTEASNSIPEEIKINKDNFFKETYADWKISEAPNSEPDYISNSGSKYWYEKEGVYRQSDHWGKNIASCWWTLEEKGYQRKDKKTEVTKTGYAKWQDFEKMQLADFDTKKGWYQNFLIREITNKEDFNNTIEKEIEFLKNRINQFKSYNDNDFLQKSIDLNNKYIEILNSLDFTEYKKTQLPNWYIKTLTTPDIILHQTQHELIEDAKSFESWQDFMEYYETFGIPEVSPIPNDADSQWYQTFWELAKGLTPEQQTNEQIQQQQIESDNNSDNSPAEMDALWLATVIDDDTNFDDFIEQLRQIKTNADLNKRMLESGELESAGLTEEDIKQINGELEQYDYMLKRVRHGSFISGIVGKNELKDTHKEMIRKLIRKEPRTYREIYSILMNDSQWEVAEEDKLSTQIKTNPLANPNVDYDNLSAEQLRRYADELQNKEIAEKVKNKTVLMNDEVEKYIDSLNKEIKTLNSKLKENEQDRNEENRTIADYQERQLLKLYDELLHAKINYKNKSDEIARRIEKGIKITKKYQTDVQNAKANYDTIFRKWEDLRKATEITAQVKEAMTKREVVAELRENIKGKQKEKRILEDIKKMKVQLVKRTMRRVPFTRIDYNNARALIAIQRIFEPNLMGQVNEWIGQDREFLRSFVSKWITDNDFRELIKTNFNKKLTKGRQRLLELLEKTNSESDFINWTTQERKLAHRLMPKENWIKELNLETLAEEREGSIQLDIDFIEERKIVYDPIKKQDVEFVITRPVISEELEMEVKDYLGVDLFNQVINKPFATWTIAEMETLAKRVDEIYTEGRDILKNKREIEKERINEIREKIRATIKDTGIVINDDDDEKTKQQKIEKINKILGKNSTVKGTLADKESGFFYKLNSILNGYADANIHRVTRILDNYSEGINTSELYAKENTCYNLKERAIRERDENISKLMQENNITLDELYNSVTIAGQSYTIDELLYIIAANKDYVEKENSNIFNDETDFYNLKNNDDSAPTARNAVMFGNLLSSQEMLEFKESCKREDEEMLRKIESGELTAEEKALLQINQLDRTPGTSSYISACKLQMERILSYTKKLDPKFTKLLDAIELDYSTQYDKMNKVSIDIFNAPVWRVKHYVPLIRLESNGETNENRVKEDLLGTAGIGKQYVDKGMTQKRKHIGALNQKPVEMGLYKTWIDSVERTEHFIAYSGYVKELNAVYKNRDSQFLRQYIENRYGRNMIKYIDAYINEVANPDANKVRTTGDEILRTLRGKTAPAYLAWKASGILKQAVTSPWPFMQFVTPIEYLSSCFKCFDPKIQDAIKNKSVFMKNRVMDPMNELVDEMSEKKTNKVEHAINKFNKIGMQGLEAIDWACVAPGWLACYNKEYTRLQKENENIFILTKQQLEEENYNIDFNSPSYLTNEQIIKKATDAQKSEAEIEMMAINYADDCTRLSQPSSRVVDLAPLYKQNSEAWKTLLQFQTSLNVIWQNLKYDLPYAIKQKEFKQIIGAIMGYLFAGLTVNAITAGFTDGDDDDENDTENAIKKALFYSTTQFSDAIPIIGSAVTNMTEKIVTGKSSSYSNNTNMMPMINTLIQAGQYSIDKDKWDKAAKKYLEAIGLATGLPVSGTKELLYTVGIGDNEEGLEFKPEAIIGRRK